MPVTFEMDGPLAIATFRSPPMNTLTDEAFDGFADAMQAALNAKARAFLTLAEGEHFCAGADVISNFEKKDSNAGRRKLARVYAVVQNFERLPFPTVIAIRGLCLGGGCELMQLHDIIFAGEGAGIGQVEAQIATSTLLGGAARLVSRIGLSRAKEMVFSAEPYDANTLLSWGLINKVLPDAEVEAAARAFALKLAHGPTVALRIGKALINAAAANGLAAADALTMELTPQTFDTVDMREAVKRFAEKGARRFRDGLVFKGE